MDVWEYGTQIRYDVNGFAQKICAACRDEKEEAYPMHSATYGGKIGRYYWREIEKTYLIIAYGWLKDRNMRVKDIFEFEHRFPKEAKSIKKDAKRIWQKNHKDVPKYDLKELTEAEFLSKVSVPQQYLTARYSPIQNANQKIGKWINQNGHPSTAEDIVAEWYRTKGFSVKRCEGSLISVLVGTLCISVIQDTEDPRRQIRIGYSGPEDFGTQEYFKRRSEAFDHLMTNLRGADGLEVLYKELLSQSISFRKYLGVDNEEAVELGLVAIRNMSQSLILKCIEWAIKGFWYRRSGWPDLFIFNDNTFCFVEVKSPKDELSLDQMNWFRWAIEEANIPCEIVRLQQKATASCGN